MRRESGEGEGEEGVIIFWRGELGIGYFISTGWIENGVYFGSLVWLIGCGAGSVGFLAYV